MKGWEKNIRRVVPYVPGDQPAGERLIKLNTNENPYPPAPGVKRALKEMDYDRLRKYPDPASLALTDCLAAYYGVEKDQVFVGVGSDDVLAMAFLTFFNSEKPILFPDISYSFYKVWAELFEIPYEMVALDEGFHILPKDYYRENGGVIFPNPNAPTGLLLGLEQVEDILQHNQDVIVIVDEAYIDFGGRSALSLLDRYENLLVVQTFSKARSMAGMRIGFAVGSPRLIRAINDVKYSYNSYTMNMPSLILGVEAVRDEAYFKETVGKIVKTRERAKERLGQLGFTFPDSMANFIFAKHEKAAAVRLFEALKERQIYVRYFAGPRLENYLRITIGTDEEMEELYRFLEGYLEEDGWKAQKNI
ncbi:MAG: histidinol-phosphate transaminase [Lachnospiraceae bacterium]|nr:histidinol-phosphate transaminase [Lachnospiraceae bacterium]MCI9106516.1 histidinol-phosphate transaminase [Lachnospiraceae bacterium]